MRFLAPARTSRPSRFLTGLLLVLALGASGCVSMPVDGPIVTAEIPEDTLGDSGTGSAYEPPRPAVGASQQEIVRGFLEAMKAVPVRATAAQEFLTAAGRERWHPERASMTYAAVSSPRGEGTLRVRVEEVEHYDASGRWLANAAVAQEQLEFSLVEVRGEWRIDRAPNALVVPQTWFDTNFVRAGVYFLTRDDESVVAEPVRVPAGEQMVTSLVRALVNGPAVDTREVLSTAVPSGAQMATRSVSVSETGVAEVAFQGPEDSVDGTIGDAFAAQLAWTLREVPGVQRVRVRWNGSPLAFEGIGAEATVRGSTAFAPWGPDAVLDPYGIVEGRLVAGLPEEARETTGPFGVRDLGLSEIAVSWDGTTALGISANRRELLRARVKASDSGSGSSSPEVVLRSDGTLSAPRFDARGRAWVLENESGSPRILVADAEEKTQVRLPALPGGQVRDFLVSPDATRLVVLTGGITDHIMVLRLRREESGQFEAITPRRIATQVSGRKVLDLDWGRSGDLSVMTSLTRELSDIRVVAVDGAPGDTVAPSTWRVRPGQTGLATSLVPGTVPFVFAGSVARDLRDETTVMVDLPQGLTALFHAG